MRVEPPEEKSFGGFFVLNRRKIMLKNLKYKLLLFSILCILLNANMLFAGTVTLAWDVPTTNTDGTLLTDLAGYKVYYGTSSGSYNQSIDVGNVTTYTLNLTDGTTYYFTVIVYNTVRSESMYSNEACRTIGTTTCSGGGSGGGGNNLAGGDTSISGGGCGFVKDINGKGQKAKGEGLIIAMLFLLLLTFLKLKKQNILGGLFIMMNVKKSLPSLLSFSFALLLFSEPTISEAATYYVSNSGSATLAQCTNISTPCAVQTAFNNAVAGDIVYFRGGTYTMPAKNFSNTYHGYYEPAYSGIAGNPITFAAYPAETPVFNGTAGGSGDVSDYATIFGTWGRSYIVFDGFTLQADNGTKMARVHIGSDDSNVVSTNITIKNCSINGGSTLIPTQDNRETVRIDYANDVLIQRCKLYNARSTNGYQGINGIKSYGSNRVTIENNELYNTEGAIYLKSDTDSWVVRNNWLHDNQIGIYVTPYVTSRAHNATNHKFYNNVINNSSYSSIHVFGEAGSNADNMEVYSNTVYSILGGDSYISAHGIFLTEGANFRVYNNILQGVLSFGYGNYSIAESDYNQFGSPPFRVTTHIYFGTQSYTSLASWQATTDINGGLHPDTHSLASNPLFQNSSNTLTQLNDFTLANNSPSKGTGKGSVDMGANIASVGTGAKVPSSTNLKIQ